MIKIPFPVTTGLNIFNSTDFISPVLSSGNLLPLPPFPFSLHFFLYKFFPYIICSKHRSIIFLLFCIQTLTGSRASMLQVTFPVPVCCMIALNMETTTSSFSCGMNIVFNRWRAYTASWKIVYKNYLLLYKHINVNVDHIYNQFRFKDIRTIIFPYLCIPKYIQ